MLLAIRTCKNQKQYQKYCELNHDLAMDFESYEVAAVQIKEDLIKLVNNK